MKSIKHLFTTLLLLCATMATAHDFEAGGIYYNILSSTDKTVEVTYRGDNSSSYDNEYTGSVVIPESVTYNGSIYSVTSIGKEAFDNCKGLTSVVIGDGVTSIGSYAFQNCTGLTSITIPNSVKSIGWCAFYNCSEFESIKVKSGNSVYDSRDSCNAIIETATNELIVGCQNTIIPSSVTSIGRYAFYNCTGLTSITIPNSVTSIGYAAFDDCTGLTSVVIGNGVTSIGWYAFDGCKGLTSITIPNSVTSIEHDAFAYCTGLTSITIPNSVTSIESGAFSGCTGLTNVTVETGNTKYNSRDNCNAIIETQTNTLIAGCQNTIIPNSVTSIGESAFFGCTGLTSITIPNSVTSIGERAFWGCSGLTSITIPNSVTSIGKLAFYFCRGLTSITIPNSVTSIGEDAFCGCTGLKTVFNFSNLTFSKGLKDYGYVAYYAENVYNASELSLEGDFIFGKPNNVNTLLYYLGNEIELTLPDDYKGENYAIGEKAFNNCTELTRVEICNGVTSIGNYAFRDCTGLTSVVIGNSVTSIGSYAFQGCAGLKTVFNFSNLTFSEGSEDNGYVACYADKVYNVPNGSKEGDFIFGKPNNVNTLLYYLGNAIELTLPDDYKGENYAIGEKAFNNCIGLTLVEICNGVTSIGNYAFEGCSNIETLYISSTIESIGIKAFDGCDKIKEIKVGAEKPIRVDENIFTYAVYDNATLYIPNGTKSLYEKREPWNIFFYIVEMDYTGIENVKAEPTVDASQSGKVKAIYDLNGRMVENPTKGVYIIDGKKVLVK